MPTRSGRNRTTTSPSCQHCGRTGHTANICPRDDYSPDVPALTCTQCVRSVTTATGGISQFQMVCTIDPCAAHSTLSAQPPTQAAPLHFPLLWPPLQEVHHHNLLLLSILLNLNLLPSDLTPLPPQTLLLFRTLDPLLQPLLDATRLDPTPWLQSTESTTRLFPW